MSDDDHAPQRSFVPITLGLLALVILPFVPLLLSLVEGSLFGTHQVEEFCRKLGLHASLGRLYEAVFRLIGFHP